MKEGGHVGLHEHKNHNARCTLWQTLTTRCTVYLLCTLLAKLPYRNALKLKKAAHVCTKTEAPL